jgi:eukaryotic-like serine/threonine-protein kinase
MIRPAHEPGESGVDPFVDAYEAAQARDGHAEPADFLPDPDDPLYPDVLCELIRVDLEYAWSRGQPRRLEAYRAEFPALFRDPDRLRLVAFEELRLRRQAGEDPCPSEYLRRFGVEGLERDPPGARGGRAGFVPPSRNGRHSAWAETFASTHDLAAGAARVAQPRTTDARGAAPLAFALALLPEAGSDFAGFRLIRELGRGAFGRVFLARQGDLADRHVALKVSPAQGHEPQALAQLQHTNIVPIYSVHRVGPLQAVCMPYFGATTLADVLRGTGRPGLQEKAAGATAGQASREAFRGPGRVAAILRVGLRLADGLAHAHGRGILHRDLKPANVLLTDHGEPMLLDFNLAADTKLPGDAPAAMLGGTLPYMAPEALEALRGGDRPVDARSDLYALGLILFELLTGRHPFPTRRGPVHRVVPQLIADRHGPPPPLPTDDPAITPAVRSILRRCLEPDPSRRYEGADQLREDLRRQLDDLPLRYAREPSFLERARKWARRHPRLAASAALGGVAVALIGAVVALSLARERRLKPAAADDALLRLAEDYEEANICLLDPAAGAARRAEGVAACRRALARFRVLEDPSWQDRSPCRDLPPAARAELRDGVGELLLLWSRDLAARSAALAPPERAALLRDALQRNARAESCYRPGEAPRHLWAQRSALLRLAGDDAEARHAAARAAAIRPGSPRDLLWLILDDPRAISGDDLAAIASAVRRSPRDFTRWMLLGQCHALLGRPAEAEDCFTVAISLRPRSPWPYFHRGRAALEREEFDQARLDFDQALALRPGWAEALVNRALARLGVRDHAGAIGDLTLALECGAPACRTYLIRSRARLRAGDAAGADRDRVEGLRRTPDDAEGWVARGLARRHTDPRGALADFEAALAIDPRSRAALVDKAHVLSESLGLTAAAVRVLDRAVSWYPDDAPARVGRGVLLARLGRRDAAHRDAEEARRRDASAATNYRAACIYALTAQAEPADRPVALRLLATAMRQDPGLSAVARGDPDLAPLRDRAEGPAEIPGDVATP